MINLMLIFILLVLTSPVSALEENNDSNLLSFCPFKGEIENWQPDGDSEIAVGEDLYLVINGGAEIYHEYGFKNAIFQTYSKSTGNSINLEIYEMESNAAAFGMYSFKTGKEGIPLKLGYTGLLETYYLNFWKGNYLVTLTSMKTDTSCIADLKKLANSVDKKIKCTSNPPSLIPYLPEEHLQKNSITYLKGNLALFNQDIFGPKNIFGLKEGVIGEYPDYLILIIKYKNIAESKKLYKFAANHFQKSENYKNFANQKTHFEINDSKNNKFWMKSYNNYLIIIRGQEIINTSNLIDSIKEKIEQ
jgi:uncharacterized protein DUF6599